MKSFIDLLNEQKLICEAAYPGNIGFAEMAKFYQVADDKQIKQMEEIIKNEDWEGFKKLISKVIKVKLV
jgi:enolase